MPVLSVPEYKALCERLKRLPVEVAKDKLEVLLGLVCDFLDEPEWGNTDALASTESFRELFQDFIEGLADSPISDDSAGPPFLFLEARDV